jgi:hypothetical protein
LSWSSGIVTVCDSDDTDAEGSTCVPVGCITGKAAIVVVGVGEVGGESVDINLSVSDEGLVLKAKRIV